MRKGFKRVYRATLLLAIAFFMLSGMSITSKAVKYDKIMELKLIDRNNTSDNNYLDVFHDKKDEHISNVRTSSKHLKAALVEINRRLTLPKFETIQLFGTKKGSYWLYFDIEDSAGNHICTEKTRVIVCNEKDSYKAFKSIKIGKTNLLDGLFKNDYSTRNVTLKKGGKIKVKMRKGYKLIDITVKRTIVYPQPDNDPEYYMCNTREIKESIRNGSKIKLSEVGEDYQFFIDRYRQKMQFFDSIFAYTYVTLTYRDKSGNERKNTITIRSKLKG